MNPQEYTDLKIREHRHDGLESTQVNRDDLFGTKPIVYINAQVIAYATDNTTGDGKYYFHIPHAWDGYYLEEVHAEVITAGTTGTEDIQMLGAVEPLEYPYFQTSFWTIIRKRLFWLILLFVTQFFTGGALRHYSGALENALSLIFFIPLIISSGGNAGSQSCTIIIRGLATGEIGLSHTLRIGFRESLAGITMGLILGVIGIGRAILWDTGMNVALVVGFSLTAVVIAGTFVGAVLPMGLKKIGIDPAISSSPFV